MNDIFTFLLENSGWIKDLSTVLFTATATIIAVLTYRRAKSTIFQPKRTEVIKIQSRTLIEFLNLFTAGGNSIDDSIDYTRIYRYNVDLALRDYGLIDDEKLKLEELEENVGGWFQFLENDIHDFVLIEGTIQEYDTILYMNEKERQKFYASKAKKGEVVINRIFYTKKYAIFHKKLRDLSNNPFIPKDIQDVANQIGKNMFVNLHLDLRVLLKKLVTEVYQAHNDKTTDQYEVLSEDFRYATLWRIFEKQRRNHDEDYRLLTKRIREYLMIDRKW